MDYLKVIGLLVGLAAGLLTVIVFFSSPDADSLLQSLGEMIPAAATSLNNADSAIAQFVETRPMGPALAASLLFAVITVGRLLMEVVFERISTEFSLGDVSIHALAFLPWALAWIWVFSGAVSGLTIGIFLAVYVVVSITSTGISANYEEIASAISGVWGSLRARVSRRSDGNRGDW